jgi:hypothetical protein
MTISLALASIVLSSCPALPVLPVARVPAGPEVQGAVQDPGHAIRRPAGIYAVLPLDEDAQTARSRKRSDPKRIESLLQNEAVAGVALRVGWRDLEPGDAKYDFAELDDALQRAAAHKKTLQLIVVPGYLSPEWLLKELPSADPYLDDPSKAPPGFKSGKATFAVSYGPKKGEVRELPLPWNRTYKDAWQAFLAELARRYGEQALLVSVAVAGPTSVSVEMSLPNRDDDLRKWRALLKMSFPPGPTRNRTRRSSGSGTPRSTSTVGPSRISPSS